MSTEGQETKTNGYAVPRRVAVASFEFEGNHFSNTVYDRDRFGLCAEGKDLWLAIDGLPIALSGGVEALRADPMLQLVPILVAQGGSGGGVERRFFDQTVDAIVAGLRDAGELDGIYLALHGAMISDGIDDAEGYLLGRIREELGERPIIAVSLDLHGNVTPAMAQHANILVGYRNYPHDDAYDTGRRAATLLRRTLHGEITPMMVLQRLAMLVPVSGGSTAVAEAPLAHIKQRALDFERDGLLSVSYFTCQPWLDDDDAMNAVIAIADRDRTLAACTAKALAEDLWSRREAFELPLLGVEQAVDQALRATCRPVIVADTGDSVGAGAAGDSVCVLAALLEQAPHLRSVVSLVDAAVAAQAIAQGPGALLEVGLGFSVDPRYGQPLPLKAQVVSVHDGAFTYAAGIFAGVTARMGPTAVLAVGGHRILVSSVGTYEFADEHFKAVGIEPEQFDVVVLKNGMNYRNLLVGERIAILADTVGASSANLAALPWRHRTSPFWPRDRAISDPLRA